MTPFAADEGREALFALYLWLFPPFSLITVIRPDFLLLTFDEVLSPDPTLVPPDNYNPLVDGVDIDSAYHIWVCAAMLDAALCGTDYTEQCNGYEKEYHKVRKRLRKQYTRKQAQDAEQICKKAVDALAFITGQICICELADSLGEQNKEFLSSVSDLQAKLQNHIIQSTL